MLKIGIMVLVRLNMMVQTAIGDGRGMYTCRWSCLLSGKRGFAEKGSVQAMAHMRESWLRTARLTRFMWQPRIPRHHEDMKRVLDHRKHVLCEKAYTNALPGTGIIHTGRQGYCAQRYMDRDICRPGR